MVDYRDIGQLLLNTKSPEQRNLGGFQGFVKILNDTVNKAAEEKAAEQLAKEKEQADKFNQMVKQAEEERKVVETISKYGAPKSKALPGAGLSLEQQVRGVREGLIPQGTTVAPSAVAQTPTSLPNLDPVRAEELLKLSPLEMNSAVDRGNIPVIQGQDAIKGGLELPEVKPQQKTRLPPETTAIDIIGYYSENGNIVKKKIGEFQGRVGMSPRMVPIDNKTTDTQNSTIASQDVAIGNLQNLRGIMQRGNIGDYGQMAAQYIGNPTALAIALKPFTASGAITEEQAFDIMDYNSELNSAKQNIAVARGGKQLTNTELQLITGTLPRAVQDPKLWDTILDRYADEFDRYRTAVKGGKVTIGAVNRNPTEKAKVSVTPEQQKILDKLKGK